MGEAGYQAGLENGAGLTNRLSICREATITKNMSGTRITLAKRSCWGGCTGARDHHVRDHLFERAVIVKPGNKRKRFSTTLVCHNAENGSRLRVNLFQIGIRAFAIRGDELRHFSF